MTAIRPDYITMAKNYLSSKKRTPHFEIRYINDCCPIDGWSTLEPLSEEEIESLVKLREKYGNDDFVNHLEEVFDEDTLHDIAPGEIIHIDLETHHYMYNFKYHQISDKGVMTGTIKLNLSDEIYVKLLAMHLENINLNINNLKYADKSLYEIITRDVDACFCYDGAYEVCDPYTVTMDEIRADAQNIREQNPDYYWDINGIVGYIIY